MQRWRLSLGGLRDMEGKRKLNFSEPERITSHQLDEMVEQIERGDMPMASLHPEARLQPEDRAALIAGLRKTFSQN